jgi:hypothetical protein
MASIVPRLQRVSSFPADEERKSSAKKSHAADRGCQMVYFKTKFGYTNLEGLAMNNARIFYGSLAYFMTIWYNTYMAV